MAPGTTPQAPRLRRGDRLEIVVSWARSGALRGQAGRERRLALVRLRGAGPGPVEGELVEVRIDRLRAASPVIQVAGTLLSRRLVVGALGIQPLALELRDDSARLGARRDRWPTRPADCVECEMERCGPRRALAAALEQWRAGRRHRAERLLREALEADIRCLEAHARLGYFAFCAADGADGVGRALRHYRTGLKIGQLSLGAEFDDLLPWRLPGNRPYLRCLYGYGLCLWRLGDLDGARIVMRRFCRLSPGDQVPARLALLQLEAGSRTP